MNPAASAGGAHILVVDDDEDILRRSNSYVNNAALHQERPWQCAGEALNQPQTSG